MGYAPLWRSLRSNLGHFEIASVRRNLVVNSLPPCKREKTLYNELGSESGTLVLEKIDVLHWPSLAAAAGSQTRDLGQHEATGARVQSIASTCCGDYPI